MTGLKIGRYVLQLGQIVKGIGIITALGILDYLLRWNLLSPIYGFFVSPIELFLRSTIADFNLSPRLFTIVFLAFIFLIWIIWNLQRKLNVVAGEFKDNLQQGLGNWEYGGEGWKTEYEDGEMLLSVSESQDGGISKRGFTWTSYEFNFEVKVISGCAAWIVRAENRSKFFMIQLNLTKPQEPLLRPHFRINDTDFPWIVIDGAVVGLNNLELKTPIKLMEWIKVKTVVRGSEIDIFLNDEHVLHYFLPDPCRFEQQKMILTPDGEKQLSKSLIIISYPIGAVGFRCAPPGEHAHFRKIAVKPIS